MYSKPNWSVSEWGSQIVDANNTVILTAPDFISSDDSKHVASNVFLASHAPEMLDLIKSLIDSNAIENENSKKMAEAVLEKIFSKL